MLYGYQTSRHSRANLISDKENISISSNIQENRKTLEYYPINKLAKRPNDLNLKSQVLISQNENMLSIQNNSVHSSITLPYKTKIIGNDLSKKLIIPKPKKSTLNDSKTLIPSVKIPNFHTLTTNGPYGFPSSLENKLDDQVIIGDDKQDSNSYDTVKKIPKKDIKTLVNISTEISSKTTTMTTLDIKDQLIKSVEPYLEGIIDTLKQKEKTFVPIQFLKNHKIQAHLRAKMVDWMIEVLSSYKCSEQTFFVAVNIMDLYFQKTQEVLDVSDLHLTGVSSMFIASKYEEIYPLRLKTVYEKIAHKKLTIESIKQKEKDILETLNFKLTGVTPYEFIMTTLCKMNIKERINEKLYQNLYKLCIYTTKMIMHDYSLINEYDYSTIAASILFIVFKLLCQYDQNYLANDKIKEMMDILKVQEELLINCSKKAYLIIKNFEVLYSSLDNLKKFNGLDFAVDYNLISNH